MQSFLSITSHPLANSFVPNPNERGTPLSFGVPPFSYVFRLLWRIFLHRLLFFSYLFPSILPFPSIFPLFATIFLRFFPTFFLSFLHLPSLSALLPSIFPLLLTIVLQFLSLHSSLHTLHSLHSTLYTEAQTICSYNHSSVSRLIPLQTLLFRTPTNAALRWASEFLHFPTFSTCFGGFSFIVYCFFPTFFLGFLQFPPFSPCFQRFSFVFFLPFSCHALIFLHFPPFSTICLHFLSFVSYFFPGIPPFFHIFLHFPPVLNDFPSFHLLWRIFLHCLLFFPTFFLAFLQFPPFSPCFQRFSFVFFLPFSCHSSIYLPFLLFFSYFFPGIPPFSSISSCFQRFSFVFSALFPVMP